MLEQTVHVGFPPSVVALFVVLVIGFLALDLYAHRGDKAVSLKNAIGWSLVWVAVALGFAGYLYVAFDKTMGTDFAALFLTGYALEKVLSIDNLMVFVAIFGSFAVPDAYRHRVLFYGVIGAIVFRLIFVSLGSVIYAIGPWVDFVFAAIIAWTAYKMLQDGGDEAEIEDYSQHWSVKLTKRFIPIFPRLDGHNFFVSRQDIESRLTGDIQATDQIEPGRKFYATPLFLCLIAIEFCDVLFAFDSVPAVIAVTKEPLLVYSAMIFAILGLRQLYFVLAALQKYLTHLAKAVIILLFFIAFKLVVAGAHHLGWTDFHIAPSTSLTIVLGVLLAGVIASILFPPKDKTAQ